MKTCNAYRLYQLCKVSNKTKKEKAELAKMGKVCKLPKKDVCNHIHLLKKEYVSVDSQLDKFIRDTLKNPDVPATKYRGFAETAIFGLAYLLRRNKNECVILSNFLTLAQKIKEHTKVALYTIPDIEWEDIGFVWHYKNGLTLPGKSTKESIANAMTKCVENPKTRFVIFIMTLASEQNYHANILLYDAFHHTCERFDPYLAQLPNMNLDRLDKELNTFFAFVDPYFRGIIPPPNLNFFDSDGLQQDQERDRETDPSLLVGYCQPFTILYADTRLAFPNQTAGSIAERYKTAVMEQSVTLTSFIRNYSQYLHEQMYLIFQKYKAAHDIRTKYRDPRVPLLAAMLEEMETYQTVFT